MRAFPLFLACASIGLMACGSSGSPKLIDASVPVPDAFVCAQQGTVNAPNVLDFSAGGPAQGAVPAMGTQLTVVAVVTFNDTPTMGFIMIQRNNTGIFTVGAGKAGRFETPPALGTYPMDTDNNFGFGIDFVDGITRNTDGTASIRPTQVALLDTAAGGMVKIDMWTPAAVPNGTSTIAATFTNARFKGFTVKSDGSLDQAGNGCNIMLPNLQFRGLSVKWQAGAFPAAVTPPTAVTTQTAWPASIDPSALGHLPVFEMDRE